MNNILSKSLENRYSKTKWILNNAQASFKESRGIMIAILQSDRIEVNRTAFVRASQSVYISGR